MEHLNDGHVIELAQIYYDKLREMLTPEQVRRCKERQRVLPASVSALHEVCDPIPVMRAALETMLPGKWDAGDDTETLMRLVDVARPLGEMFLYQLSGFEHSSQESGETDTRYAGIVKVQDPDSGQAVRMQVHKDEASGVMFAVDESYLEANRSTIRSPFNPGRLVLQTAPADVDMSSPNLDLQGQDASGATERLERAHFSNKSAIEALLKVADNYGADEGQDAQASLMDEVFVCIWSELTLGQRAAFLSSPEAQEIFEVAGGEDAAQEIRAMAQSLDESSASSALKLIAQLPLRHGTDSDPDHEIGDWQEFIRIAWGVASPAQRVSILCAQRLGNALGATELKLHQTPSQVENWEEIADFYAIDTSFDYSDRAIVEYANMYALEPFSVNSYAYCEGWGHIFGGSEVHTRWLVDRECDEVVCAQAMDGIGKWHTLNEIECADLMQSIRDNDALSDPEEFNIEFLSHLPEWAHELLEEPQYPRERGN